MTDNIMEFLDEELEWVEMGKEEGTFSELDMKNELREIKGKLQEAIDHFPQPLQRDTNDFYYDTEEIEAWMEKYIVKKDDITYPEDLRVKL